MTTGRPQPQGRSKTSQASLSACFNGSEGQSVEFDVIRVRYLVNDKIRRRPDAGHQIGRNPTTVEENLESFPGLAGTLKPKVDVELVTPAGEVRSILGG